MIHVSMVRLTLLDRPLEQPIEHRCERVSAREDITQREVGARGVIPGPLEGEAVLFLNSPSPAAANEPGRRGA